MKNVFSELMEIHVTHVTTVHPRYDTRIFYRECMWIARFFNSRVDLFVMDGGISEERFGVRIQSLGRRFKFRLLRAVFGNFLAYKKIRRRKGIIHFHDPELLPAMYLLSFSSCRKIIFDMHENIAKDILTKPWLPRFIRPFFSEVYKFIEKIAVKNMFLVLAESSYMKSCKYNTSKSIVMNYADIDLIRSEVVKKNVTKRFSFGYLGACSYNRGIGICIDAIAELRERGLNVNLLLIGGVENKLASDKNFLKGLEEGWLVSYGRLDAVEAWSLLAEAKVGLAILQNEENFIHSYPTKIFEYMCIGMPMIVSNFALYHKVIDDAKCGLCVEPNSIEAVAGAMEYFILNVESAKNMGRNGYRYVENNYNWKFEFEKLIELYSKAI